LYHNAGVVFAVWEAVVAGYFSWRLAVKPMPRRLGAGTVMSWRMAESMAAMASSWVTSFFSMRASS
jgi:hypothetical protein